MIERLQQIRNGVGQLYGRSARREEHTHKRKQHQSAQNEPGQYQPLARDPHEPEPPDRRTRSEEDLYDNSQHNEEHDRLQATGKETQGYSRDSNADSQKNTNGDVLRRLCCDKDPNHENDGRNKLHQGAGPVYGRSSGVVLSKNETAREAHYAPPESEVHNLNESSILPLEHSSTVSVLPQSCSARARR